MHCKLGDQVRPFDGDYRSQAARTPAEGVPRMGHYKCSSHARLKCNSRVIFVPKRRRTVLYGQPRKRLGEVLRTLAEEGINIQMISASEITTSVVVDE
jgi:hypothetical protein